jgi:hypothetical protein
MGDCLPELMCGVEPLLRDPPHLIAEKRREFIV